MSFGIIAESQLPGDTHTHKYKTNFLRYTNMKLIIPTTLKDITLSQFIKFRNVINEDMDSDTIAIYLVSIFCNISLEDTLNISAKDFKEVVQTISTALESKPTFNQRFTYNGIEYGMIPNLDKISAGEYMDLDLYYSKDFVKFMSVLFRPIKKKTFDTYLIEDYKGSNDDLKDIPLEYYLGSQVFFCNLKSDLLIATNHYLQQLKQPEREVLEQALGKNGDGINQFTQLLTETSMILKRQLI